MEEADLDFSLTDEQRLLQDQIDSALGGISPLARVRSQAEQPNQLAEDVWRGLRDLGILGVLVPEAFGGLGLGALDAARATPDDKVASLGGDSLQAVEIAAELEREFGIAIPTASWRQLAPFRTLRRGLRNSSSRSPGRD